jgi:serine/threonine protein kinase
MQFSGTPTYMAQELFLKRSYNQSVDVFALGTLIYEIYTGEVPYHGLDPADIKEKVLKDGNLPNKISVKKSISEISIFNSI